MSDFGYQFELRRRAMACDFQVLLAPSPPAFAVEAALDGLRSLSELEDRMSIYREASDFSIANREASQRPVSIHSSLAPVVAYALEANRLTQGAFDWTTATLSDVWGFSRRSGNLPSPSEIDRALDACGSQFLLWNPNDKTLFYTRPGMKINPGGIGKGYALDVVASTLKEAGVADFLIQGGRSSCLTQGDQQGREGWCVAVRHPIQHPLLLGELTLRDQGLGTSGSANQFFYHRGQRFSHILDPRTGWPAQHWLSVTVVAPTGIEADAMATAIFVMGEEEIDRFAIQQPWLGILAIRDSDRRGGVQMKSWNLDDECWRQSLPD